MAIKVFQHYRPEEILSEIKKVLDTPRMTKVKILFEAEIDSVPTLKYEVEKYTEGADYGTESK